MSVQMHAQVCERSLSLSRTQACMHTHIYAHRLGRRDRREVGTPAFKEPWASGTLR